MELVRTEPKPPPWVHIQGPSTRFEGWHVGQSGDGHPVNREGVLDGSIGNQFNDTSGLWGTAMTYTGRMSALLWVCLPGGMLTNRS
jgi:hypothetical protein